MKEDHILSQLKFIGQLKKDYKIDVTNMLLLPNTIKTSIIRSFSNDSRKNTIFFLNNTIQNALNLLILYKSKQKMTEYKNLIDDLVKAQTGLNKIKDTYESDTKFGCDINIIIQRIQTILLEHNIPYKNKKE